FSVCLPGLLVTFGRTQSIEAPAELGSARMPAQRVLHEIVERAGSQIPWIRDPWVRFDRWRRNAEPQPPQPIVDRSLLLDRALARARAENKLVLVHVPRIEGRPMYRAPILDDYMRLTLWSDPATIDLVSRRFVPLRLVVDESVSERLKIDNSTPDAPTYLDALEPAVFFLAPDGSIVHRVDRIRTFSPCWFRELALDVLEMNPETSAPSIDVALARAQAAALERKSDRSSVRMGDVSEDPHIELELWLARQEIADGNYDLARAAIARTRRKIVTFLTDVEAAALELEKSKPAGDSEEYQLWARRDRAQKAQIAKATGMMGRMILSSAAIERLERRPSAALEMLEGVDGELAKELFASRDYALELARCHVARGRYVEALDALAKNADTGPEGKWLRGTCLFKLGRIEEADRDFADAVAMATSPWSNRAAAMLAVSDDTTRRSPLAHGFEMVEDVSARAVAGRPAATTELRWDGEPGRVLPQVAREAFEFLLSQQCEDGSWRDARYAYWPTPDILPNVRVAVTALAATALLAWRDFDEKRVDAALARAERYLRDDDRVALGTEEEVYSQAYRILYWTRRAAARFGVSDEPVKNLSALVQRASAIQDKNTGFFAHEYKNAFCTGSMLWSIWLAKQAGVAVEDDLVHLGLSALRSARRDDGSFSYGGSAADRDSRRPPAESITRLKDSSARMPVCESVLHAFGSSDGERLAHAYETFLTYLDRLARVRKADFHSDGELGGFFFWHAVFHASEALEPLEPELEKRVRDRVRQLVVSIQEIDGSFVDSHELGKSYGTAMALLTMANLR
ncbi:MAG: hypothetical protein KDC95_06600, partial [Planctomycetes bacterium]|nr:hypothetical protein [Planctomycetota bacterium]